jgi:hypothetical protein
MIASAASVIPVRRRHLSVRGQRLGCSMVAPVKTPQKGEKASHQDLYPQVSAWAAGDSNPEPMD